MAAPAIIHRPAVTVIKTWKVWQSSSHPVQLVDVRSATEFACIHLPGATKLLK